MRISQKGFIAPILLALIALLLLGGGAYVYVQTKVTPTAQILTVTYPNGGEVVKYGDIYMAGELYFNWTTSLKETYVPTSNLKAYVIDASGKTVREESPVPISIMNLGGGTYRDYFSGERGLKRNEKYKIKVCDYIGSKESCDSSDGYFTIQ